MNILLLLIPLGLLLLLAAVCAFAWAVRRGQFDDLDTPAIDILCDEPPPARAAAAPRPREPDGRPGRRGRRHAD